MYMNYFQDHDICCDSFVVLVNYGGFMAIYADVMQVLSYFSVSWIFSVSIIWHICLFLHGCWCMILEEVNIGRYFIWIFIPEIGDIICMYHQLRGYTLTLQFCWKFERRRTTSALGPSNLQYSTFKRNFNRVLPSVWLFRSCQWNSKYILLPWIYETSSSEVLCEVQQVWSARDL
jgi:hypothetical protein